MFKYFIGVMIVTTFALGGIISSLSGPMSGAVSAIDSKASGVMNGYISSFDEVLKKQKTIEEKYKKRKENSTTLAKKEKNIEVLLQGIQFEYTKNRGVEKLRPSVFD